MAGSFVWSRVETAAVRGGEQRAGGWKKKLVKVLVTVNRLDRKDRAQNRLVTGSVWWGRACQVRVSTLSELQGAEVKEDDDNKHCGHI